MAKKKRSTRRKNPDVYSRLLKAIKNHSGLTKREIIDAGRHGADAGWGGFTYTTEAVKFYNKNEDDIYELLNDMADQMGYSNVEQLVSTFNRSDMLSWADGRKNLLAWFALEEVGRYYDR